MNDRVNAAQIEELKQRAKAGDAEAVVALRASGYFERKRRERDGYAVSHAQERLWFLDQLLERSSTYNVPSAIRLKGRFDARAFEQAIGFIVRRHESLRTTFDQRNGEVRQFIHDDPGGIVQTIDLTGAGDPLAEARRLVGNDASTSFDLKRGPLIRVQAIALGDEDHVLSFNLHHSICDEWSLGLLLEELQHAYGAALEGSDPDVASLRIQYKDFAAWQNRLLSGDSIQPARDYWLAQLEGPIERLNLPYDFPRPAMQTQSGKTIEIAMPGGAVERLSELGGRFNASAFTVIAAALQAFLYRYTGQGDIAVGAPFSGRTHPDVEAVIGFFVNTVCLRASYDRSCTFSDALKQTERLVKDAIAYQDYPFDRLVDDLHDERDPARTPFFDVMLVVQPPAGEEAFRLGPAAGEPLECSVDTAKFDLTFEFAQERGGLTLRLNFNTDLFAEETIRRLGRCFSVFLNAVTAAPDTPVETLPLLDADDRRRVTVEWNGAHASWPEDETILSLFVRQTRSNPDRTALISPGGAMSYAELDESARRVAAAIRAAVDASAQEPVAIVMGRSERIVAAILGVQYAGGVYAPIDPEYPSERIDYILNDCGARVAVSEEPYIARLREAYPSIQWIDAKDLPENGFDSETLVHDPEAPIYMIYTSGSTGRPKGCVITHRNVVRLMASEPKMFDFGPDDVWICAHSFCFDFSVWEMYGALLFGGRLVIAERADVQNVEAFHALIARHRVTVLNQTPAAFYNLTAYENSLPEPSFSDHLRTVIFGGDRLEPIRLADWAKRYPLDRVALINMYGITETTVHVTYHRLSRNDVFGAPGRSPIGRPITGVSVYVCNPALELQPPGAIGELLVGGGGVGLGYRNRPDLTSEKFIDNPFAPGEKLYRSGDLGRWSADGVLEHLGRNDQQVQVRGFRIEIGEIEAVLGRIAGVGQCAVIAVGDSPESQRLAAFVTLAETKDGDEGIRSKLSAFLPEYMVPQSIMVLDELPLTSNGKVDRKALTALADSAACEPGARAPQTETELYLAALWGELLHQSQVSADADFFARGGNSLSATSMVSRIYQDRGVKLPLQTVFIHPRLCDIAQEIERLSGGTFEAIEPAATAERYPVSPAQRRLWLIERMGANPLAYIISDAFTAAPSFSREAFERAVSDLIERHEPLRTVFDEDDGEAWQIVLPVIASPVEFVELNSISENGDSLINQIRAKADIPFDLNAGPLFRLTVFLRREAPPVILASMHHIISDGWSMRLLMDDLNELYEARLRQRTPQLADLKLQYKDYAAWQRARLASGAFDESRRYWLERFADGAPVLELPADKPRPAMQSFNGDALEIALDRSATRRIIQLGRSRGASPFMTVCALTFALLHRYAGQEDIVIGAPVARRDHPDLEPLIGFFVNTVAIRTAIDSSSDFFGLLSSVRQSVSDALAHQDYPFDQLVEELELQRDFSRSPLFDVAISLLNEAVPAPGALATDSLDIQPKISKFDLTFFFTERRDGSLGLGIEYSADLFRRERIERMGRHLATLMRSIIETAQAPIHSLPLMDEDETRRVAFEFNSTRTDYPRESTVAAEFERAARRFGERNAILFENQAICYDELNRRANRLAHELIDTHAIEREERVGILLERSPESVIAALAILKAGGAYVPLDPAYPAERLDFMIEDASCRLVLTRSTAGERTGLKRDGIRFIDVDNHPDGRDENPELRGDGASLAYVIYTSGSTGTPKGTLIEQRSILRLVLNTSYIDIQPDDCIVQTGSLSFDASTFELWGALLNGARLCLPGEDGLLDAARFKSLLFDQGCTVMFMTTSLFNQFVDADIDLFSRLRVLLTGGEKVSVPHVNRLRRHCPSLDILHVYGPTENTTFSTWHRVDREAVHDIPIGRPIANSSVLILDSFGSAQPVGVPGEICTGGDGLARGYLNQAERTRKAFVAHPFIEGERLYRSGDLGVWNDDGTVSFIGRIDNQVKVRGYRVEPGEIEARLHEIDEIEFAAVIARTTRVGTVELIAYCSGGAGLNEAALRKHLSTQLPSYMVPSRLLILGEMPLNRNGKIDRRRLPRPEEVERKASAEPRNDAERRVLDVWREVLGRDDIGIDDNFFYAGGDSIRAIQIVSRLQRQGLSVTIRDCFQHATVAELAQHAGQAGMVEARDDVVEGPVPLTPIQRWFFERHNHHLNHFNQSILLDAAERIDENAFKQTIRAIWDRHDALRMQFHQPRGDYEQYNRALDMPPDAIVVDVESDEALLACAEREQAGFDLQNTPLFKAILFRGALRDRVLLIAHHLVIDGVSWRIILEDLERVYRQFASSGTAVFEPKSDSFKRWAEALNESASHNELKLDQAYWLNIASQNADRLFEGFDPVSSVYGDCLVQQVSLSAEDTARILTEPHRAVYADANDALLAALAQALGRLGPANSCWIALEGHGREPLPVELDVSRTVGWFTSMYPHRLELSEGDHFKRLIEVKESLRAVPRKGMSYGLLRYLSDSSLSEALAGPEPQVSFNYLGQFDTNDSDSLFSISDAPTGRTISPNLNRAFALDAVAIVTGGRLHLSAIADPRTLDHAGLEALLKQWREALLETAEACRLQSRSIKTPGDFTGCPLAYTDYQAFLASKRWRAERVDDIYPCTPMQAGLLYQAVSNPESEAYFLQTSFRLRGSIDLKAFRRAWFALTARHAIFRTVFAYDGDARPLQIVFKTFEPEWSVETRPAPDEDELERYRFADRKRGFNFEQGPLVRLKLFVYDDASVDVIWSYHHLLLDGWCLRVVYEELTALYQAFRAGREPALAPAPRFADFVQHIENSDKQACSDYWRRQLDGFRSINAVVPYTRRRRKPGFRFESHSFSLSRELTASLQALAGSSNATLNVVVELALSLVLAQSNDAEDVVFGAIGSGRTAPVAGVEDMVGLLINAFPVRVRLALDEAVSSQLTEVQRVSLEAEAHATISLADIQAQAPLEGELFDALLVFANYPTELSGGDDGEGASPWMVENLKSFDQTHYDFTMIAVPGERLELKFHVNGERFSFADIERLKAQFVLIFERMAASAKAPVSSCLGLPYDEYQCVVHAWNRTETRIDSERTVVDAFETTASQRSDAIAVDCQGRRLTYFELDAAANRLANHLIDEFAVGADQFVAVYLDRSEWVLVAILGILKAGAAYVPIDPSTPRARVEHILNDSGAVALVMHSRDIDDPLFGDVPRIAVDRFSGADERKPDRSPRPGDLAYMIYTSGTTGMPKGCLIEHQNLYHYLSWARRFYFEQGSSVMGLHSSLSVDMTVTSLFMPLLTGATLYVFPPAIETPDALQAMFKPGSPFDCVKLTPSHVAVLKELDLASTGVSLAIVGGEALPPEAVKTLHQLNPSMRVVNEYGPAEATVGCIVKEVAPGETHVLIGRPIDNTQVYLLDRLLKPVPVGSPGEIYIGGAGVGRGYHNRDELTRERFIDDPFKPGKRLYRTGDVGVWLEDGRIDYLGRNDDQLSIRGHRVERQEIERCIARLACVQSAIVVPIERASASVELAAYYISSDELSLETARTRLLEWLPDYCIPAHWIRLDSIPLSSSGKVDVNSLPRPSVESVSDGSAQPANEIEAKTLVVFKDVLADETLDVTSRFFERGGHSLKAMQAVARIRKQLGARLAVRDLFENPSARELAGLIESRGRGAYEAIPPASARDDYAVSYAQKRLWLIQKIGGLQSLTAYNMPKALLLEGELDVAALDRAYSALIDRHESLRTSFIERDGEPRQAIHERIDAVVVHHDLRKSPEPDARARELIEADAHTPFNLEEAPLIRAMLIRLGERRYAFSLTINHIIGDGWSMVVLFRDLLHGYDAERGVAAAAPELRIQYKDYAEWQQTIDWKALESFWLNELKGAPGSIALPYDRAPQSEREYQGDTIAVSLAAEHASALRAAAESKQSTLSTIVLGLFYILLYQWTKQDDLCIGVSAANRSHSDLEELIGFFVNILPIRARLDAQLDVDEFIDRLNDRMRDAFDHQDYPFDLLVQRLNPRRQSTRQPIVNVIYGYQNFSDIQIDGAPPGEGAGSETMDIEEFELGFLTSKFDLTLFVSEQNDSLSFNFEYDAQLFDAASIQGLAETFQHFCESYCASLKGRDA